MSMRNARPGFRALAIPAAAALLIVASMVTQLLLGSPHALRLLGAALVALACLGFLAALLTLRTIMTQGMEFDWALVEDLMAQANPEQRRLISRMRFLRTATAATAVVGIALYLASLVI